MEIQSRSQCQLTLSPTKKFSDYACGEVVGRQEEALEIPRQPWRTASLCLAPSMNGAGWGVFAARPFAKGEIVEIAPMFLRFDERPELLKETILNNYHYEYWTWTGTTHILQTMLSFGYTMYYNHGPNPNIEHRKWGEEPDITDIDGVVSTGFFALRDIQVGEELINDYGGEEWFESRGLKLFTAPKNQVVCHQQDVETYIKKYTSKLFANYGVTKFQKVVERHEDEAEVAPYNLESIVPFLPAVNCGYGNVVTKERVNAGETLEFAPALLLKKSYVCGTLLEHIVVDWSDIQRCMDIETVRIQYQPDVYTTELQPASMLDVPISESVLLPLAGTVGLLKRSKQNPNAELRVIRDEYNENGFCFQVVATKSIVAGDIVVVDLPTHDIEPLIAELACTGQPIPEDD